MTLEKKISQKMDHLGFFLKHGMSREEAEAAAKDVRDDIEYPYSISQKNFRLMKLLREDG